MHQDEILFIFDERKTFAFEKFAILGFKKFNTSLQLHLNLLSTKRKDNFLFLYLHNKFKIKLKGTLQYYFDS